MFRRLAFFFLSLLQKEKNSPQIAEMKIGLTEPMCVQSKRYQTLKVKAAKRFRIPGWIVNIKFLATTPGKSNTRVIQ